MLFEVLYSNTDPNAKREKKSTVKDLFYLLTCLFIQACASVTPAPNPTDSPDALPWLKQVFPTAQFAAVTYAASPDALLSEAAQKKRLKGVELRFEGEVQDVAALRQEIQNTLIDVLTQNNHPEGNCVQVEHSLRVNIHVFKVLVVCVG